MAANICFQGNVGRDPETRTFNNGKTLTTFSVGVSQGYYDQSGQWQDQGTMWIDVECSPAAAKQLPWVRKGVKVLVYGLLSQRFYTDKQGVDRSSLRCYAQALGFVNKPQQQQAQQPASQGYAAPAAATAAPPTDPWSSGYSEPSF